MRNPGQRRQAAALKLGLDLGMSKTIVRDYQKSRERIQSIAAIENVHAASAVENIVAEAADVLAPAGQRPVLRVAARTNVQAPHGWPAMRGLAFDPVDDRFDLAG